MPFEAVRPRSAPEMLVRQILAGIERGELTPGERLPSQRDLAATFRVGLSSVREAVRTLHTMGCLEVVHGKGTFVAAGPAPARHDMSDALAAVSLFDLMQARQIMECRAAELAAAAADADDLVRIRGALERIEASTHDAAAFYRADFAFHLAVAEVSANRAIYEIVKRLVERVHREYTAFITRDLKNWTLTNLEKSLSTARRLLQCLETGDGPGAAAWMQRHLDIVQDELQRAYPSPGNRSPGRSTAGTVAAAGRPAKER